MRLKYLIAILLIILVVVGVAVFLPKNTQTKLDNIAEQNTVTSHVANLTETNQNPTITLPLLRVGAVTWHVKNFINKEVRIVGFVLKVEKGYVLFSDEATGAVTKGDLPVTGSGVPNMILKKKYILQGKFLYRGLTASNGSPYHLELSQLPILTK